MTGESIGYFAITFGSGVLFGVMLMIVVLNA